MCFRPIENSRMKSDQYLVGFLIHVFYLAGPPHGFPNFFPLHTHTNKHTAKRIYIQILSLSISSIHVPVSEPASQLLYIGATMFYI